MAKRATTPDSSSSEPTLRIHFDRFELDEGEVRLTTGGEPLPLPPKPFAVLCTLARAPQKLVTTNELLDGVWGHRFVSESVLKSAISDLRAALQDDAKHPRYIETVSRRGYRFIATTHAASLQRATSPSAPVTPSGEHATVGRTSELAHLHSAWQQAAAGQRQIVWIAGEAGVGKSTLIDRFMAEVGEMHCAHGQCLDQHGTNEPYLPVLEALTVLARRDATLPKLIRSVAPSWLSRLPWHCSTAEREALRDELSGMGETRMLREMGELLDRYTVDRPLLLVTEDLHWSDPATVALINHIARRRGSARLMWLASFRLTELIASDHVFNSARRELRLHSQCKEIVLDSFSEHEVAAYVAQRIPAFAAEEGFVRALHDRTDGLPLFVADVVKDLVRHGGEEVGGAAPAPLHAGWSIPESLTGIIERYLEQLRADQRELLEAASVCGVEFRLAALARVLGTDMASAAETCLELARGQRWLKEATPSMRGITTDARYAFRHPLYREVLYNRIGRVGCDALHRKFATRMPGDANEAGDSDAGHARHQRETSTSHLHAGPVAPLAHAVA